MGCLGIFRKRGGREQGRGSEEQQDRGVAHADPAAGLDDTARTGLNDTAPSRRTQRTSSGASHGNPSHPPKEGSQVSDAPVVPESGPEPGTIGTPDEALAAPPLTPPETGGGGIRVPTGAGLDACFRLSEDGQLLHGDQSGTRSLSRVEWNPRSGLLTLQHSTETRELQLGDCSGPPSELGMDLVEAGGQLILQSVRGGSQAEAAGLTAVAGQRLSHTDGVACNTKPARLHAGVKLRFTGPQSSIAVKDKDAAHDTLCALYAAAKAAGAERGGAWPHEVSGRPSRLSSAEGRRRRKELRMRKQSGRRRSSSSSRNGYLPEQPEKSRPLPAVSMFRDSGYRDTAAGVAHLADPGADELLRDPTRHGDAAILCLDCGQLLGSSLFCAVTQRKHPPQLGAPHVQQPIPKQRTPADHAPRRRASSCKEGMGKRAAELETLLRRAVAAVAAESAKPAGGVVALRPSDVSVGRGKHPRRSAPGPDARHSRAPFFQRPSAARRSAVPDRTGRHLGLSVSEEMAGTDLVSAYTQMPG